MAKLIHWRVSPATVGRYRSFERRGWPIAFYGKDGPICAQIRCVDDYVPRQVKEGKHAPLKLAVLDYSDNKYKTLKREFATLHELKAGLDRFLEIHPEFMPKDFQKDG